MGWLHVQTRVVFESDPFAEIVGLVIDESTRGEGAGGHLLAAAERWATANGHTEMRVRSNVVRTAAHQFYQNRGYTIAKTSLLFSKPLPPRSTA